MTIYYHCSFFRSTRRNIYQGDNFSDEELSQLSSVSARCQCTHSCHSPQNEIINTKTCPLPSVMMKSETIIWFCNIRDIKYQIHLRYRVSANEIRQQINLSIGKVLITLITVKVIKTETNQNKFDSCCNVPLIKWHTKRYLLNMLFSLFAIH